MTPLHSPADVAASAMAVLGEMWPIFVDSEPPEPDDVLTVKDTAPRSDGRDFTGYAGFHYGVQVRVRSQDKKTGFAKASTILVYMSKVLLDLSVTLDAAVYLVHCAANFTLMHLGKDVPKSKRSLHTVNFTVALTRTA